MKHYYRETDMKEINPKSGCSISIIIRDGNNGPMTVSYDCCQGIPEGILKELVKSGVVYTVSVNSIDSKECILALANLLNTTNSGATRILRAMYNAFPKSTTGFLEEFLSYQLGYPILQRMYNSDNNDRDGDIDMEESELAARVVSVALKNLIDYIVHAHE